MDDTVIQLENLTKHYGNFIAVDHLNLKISRGEIFGLLGPNGAGKSTTILMMLGLTEPSGGHAQVCGLDATREAIGVKKRVGYLPDDVGFYDGYTGLDNLLYTARLNRIPEQEAHIRAHQLLERVGLTAEAGKKAGKYSRGMRQRLGLADVLIKEPEVVILDEPTLGIDPQGVREFLDLIVKLSREQQITVLLSSHQLHQVQQVCDRVGIFVAGKLLASGNLAQLSAQLFPNEAFSITLRVKTSDDTLSQLLRKQPGVTDVRQNANEFHITACEDTTAELAHAIVGAGYELCYLTHQAHGLDEIYHRYFEGEKAT